MNHYHIQLIEDPQWVSYCVENECSFRNHARGYVCQTHCSEHKCSASGCSAVEVMVARARRHAGPAEFSCPVVALLDFHKPQVEFRGPWYMPNAGDSIEMGYGATECEPHAPLARAMTEAEENHLILKAAIPAMIALFSTLLTEDFARQYETVDESRSLYASSNAPCFSWMARICELAESVRLAAEPELPCSGDTASVVQDAVLKSTAAMSTLYNSRDDKIKSFMRKVACKYNDKNVTRKDFYNTVVMLTLCLFPYLKHRVLGELFNNRTLVIMCFDKTLAKHHQWSMLATCIHQHMNRPESKIGILTDGRDLGARLPAVTRVTLEKCISEARYSAEDIGMSLGQTRGHRDCSRLRERTGVRGADPSPTRQKSETETGPRAGKKRRPCLTGFYGRHEDDARLEDKVPRLEQGEHSPHVSSGQ